MVENRPLILASASLAGVFLISLISSQLELGFTHLDNIDSRMLNEIVHVRGEVKEFKEFGAGVRMLLEQDDFNIAVVYFEKITGRRGMCADVIGEVKTEKGAVEIDAKEVQLFIC